MAEQGIVEIVRLYLGRGLRGEPFGQDDEKLEMSVDLQDLGEELDVALDYLGHHLAGTLVDRPAAGLVPVGTLYAADDGTIYQSDGAAWNTWTAGGGASSGAGWMPLTTVVGGVPDLVWDSTDSLIPTYGPF